MWEVAAYGTVHPSLTGMVPDEVVLRLVLFPAGAGGAGVVALSAQGPPRLRRSVARRLLQGMGAGAEPVLQAGRSDDRWHGPLPPARENGSAPSRFWARVRTLEDAWLRPHGSLVMLSLQGNLLVLKGTTDVHPGSRDLPGIAREAGPRLQLFAPGSVGAGAQAFPLSTGDPEGMMRLKSTEIEAARVALALGYYDNPRGCTMEEIARVLGITKSAVFHRIHGLEQKAVRRLIQQQIPAPTAPATYGPDLPALTGAIAVPLATVVAEAPESQAGT